MIIDQKHFTFLQTLKFNSVHIKLNLKRNILTKKSYIGGILPIINYDKDFISPKKIIRKKLLTKKLYLAQRVEGA